MTVTDVLARRGMLGAAAAATAGLLAAGATPPAAAVASRPQVRRVTQLVAVRYRYDAATEVTTVLRARRRTVTARFVGRKVFLRGRDGWRRIPYVWSRRKDALVYDRRLHLALIAQAAPGGSGPPAEPVPDPAPSGSPGQPPAPADGGAVPPGPGAPSVASVSPYVGSDWARHLLNRAGYGPSAPELAAVRAAGYVGWLDRQLQPASVDDSACEAVLARLPDQSRAIWRVRSDIDRDVISGWQQMMSVATDHLVRAAWSRRQLLAQMTEFWANHLNVTVPGDNIAESRAHYQHTIRSHALGRVSDLLWEASRHPAMLTYLNNRLSDADHPNENQGRELLELHSVGVGAGYTQDDVVTSARILTGLSVDWESGQYEFKPWRHWVGPVSALGFTHANATAEGGEAVAEAWVRHLAARPETAQRIAEKLVTRFVSDEPVPTLAARLRDVYLANDTAIGPVLRTLFLSAEFGASAGAKTRRPVEMLAATLRVLGIGPDLAGTDGIEGLMWVAEDMGQPVFGFPAPTGYPDVAAAWSSTAVTLGRFNQVLSLSAAWWPDGLDYGDLAARMFGGTLPATHGAYVDTLGQRLFEQPVAAAHKDALLAYLGRSAADPVRSTSSSVGWRLPYNVAVLLDSPYHLYR